MIFDDQRMETWELCELLFMLQCARLFGYQTMEVFLSLATTLLSNSLEGAGEEQSAFAGYLAKPGEQFTTILLYTKFKL